MTDSAITLKDLRFAWTPDAPLLDIPGFTLESGGKCLLIGPSGSGKSTLLGLIAGVTPPQSGEITVLGERMDQMKGARRDAFRAEHLGVIFQLFNLVPYLTPVENVVLPTLFSPARGRRVEQAGTSVRDEARRLLHRLGLADDSIGRPALELSVGQQQRVAAARALIGAPGLVIADEPTSALDTDSRDAFLALLSDECARSGAALLFVSHDTSMAAQFERTIDLRELNRQRLAA
jgi:putative ABC transport system ATP-binding protein